MKKFALGLSLVALAVTGAGAAYAQQDAHQRGPDHHAMHKGGQGMMARHDTDGDGFVSRAEMEAQAAAMFARMDANSDGKIDAADKEARQNRYFDRLDTNKDGQISRAEFAAGHVRGKGDGKGDGKGGPGMHGGRHGGMRHGGGMMMKPMADANNDGAITRAEVTAAVAKHFAEADTNNDGKLSAEERRDAHQKMRAMHNPARAAGAKPSPAN